jgi:hypothetical protein
VHVSRLAAIPLLLLAVTACGGERTGTVTGEVSNATDRLCIRKQVETTRCFDASPEQLRGLVVGSCVELHYRQGSGQIGQVVTTEPRPSPCAEAPPAPVPVRSPAH